MNFQGVHEHADGTYRGTSALRYKRCVFEYVLSILVLVEKSPCRVFILVDHSSRPRLLVTGYANIPLDAPAGACALHILAPLAQGL